MQCPLFLFLMTSLLLQAQGYRDCLGGEQEFDEPDLVAICVQQEVVIDEKEEAPSPPQATPVADSNIKNPFSKKCSIENFKDNPDAISYYTGFSDYDQFMTFFYCLGPCVDELVLYLNQRTSLFLP